MLTRMTEESDGKMHSGCTAVTAFLRLEDDEGKQSFLPPHFDPFKSSMEMIEADANGSSDESSGGESPDRKRQKKSSTSKIRDAFKSLGGGSSSSSSSTIKAMPGSISESNSMRNSVVSMEKEKERIFTPNHSMASNIRKVLYCANAGDARGVLCRSGKAVRLTYDHKGSDKQEAKRIMDAGGFVMSGRVNGVLAVTRSLGDSSMKEFVVGAPYTTETELCEDDEFLILACDGVCCFHFLVVSLFVLTCVVLFSFSYGMSLKIRLLWSLSEALWTPRRLLSCYLILHIRTTLRTT